MKKKLLFCILGALLLLVLFLPIPKGQLKDGGTREYQALTYKIVDWNRISGAGVYQKTKIYFIPDCYKSLSSLWETENPLGPQKAEGEEQSKISDQDTAINQESFIGLVEEINGGYQFAVAPLEGEQERLSSDRITFSARGLEELDIGIGSLVKIYYEGGIMESYPAQIHAVGWEQVEARSYDFRALWIEKKEELLYSGFGSEFIIEEIYADCFIARSLYPMPYRLKVNGSISGDYCVGDQISISMENIYYDPSVYRGEGDLLTIEPSDVELDGMVAYKPVIYLYPEKEKEVEVTLALEGNLTCTYPSYKDGWKVKASPDGTLMDEKGQSYNYLYWEGDLAADYDLSKGFCVKGADTAAFLEEALAKLGLTRKEANEFIVYWLPLMERNPYNIIAFQEECYTEAARLMIDPAPDTLIRIFMTFRRAEEAMDLPAQVLTAPEREGFTVIEWGGTELK